MAQHRPARGPSSTTTADRAPGAAADADGISDQRSPPILTAAQTRFLRGQAHGLKAILQVGGKGLTDAVATELDGVLEHHELVKVKVAVGDREQRDALVAALAERSGAALVQRIGNVAVLYRAGRDKRQIVLPRA